jgi:hypothetical protein
VALPVDDILRRIEALEARKSIDKAPEIAAVLGGEPPPAIMLGTLVDEFEKIIRASLAKKSERQKKKWRVARDTALATFIDVIGGDRPINGVTRVDALAFRSFLAGADRERGGGDRHGQQEHRPRRLDVQGHR